MRSLRALFVFGGLTAAATALLGQAPPPIAAPNLYPAAATVSSNQADVYSGPGAAFYPTARLRYGDRVVVLGESKKSPGWLEILPPPGSFSWIDAKYVKKVPGVDRIGIVDAGDAKATAPVMPGSALVNKEPNVEVARVATGTQLFLLDRPTASGSVSWYPIAPVANEVRFLPIDAVRGGAYAGGTPGYGAPTVPTSWNQPAPTGGWQPTAGAAQPNNNWIQIAQQADQALAAGNLDRARLLYIDALAQTPDPAWRNYLNGQLQKTSAAPAASTPPVNAGSSPIPGMPAPPSAPPSGTPAAKQWSPWGVLRTAPFTSREGQPMYVLENRQNGQPLFYVTTQQGTSLRDYLGQTVAVYGAVATRNDDYIRMQYIVAEQVATPPNGAK